ncbi:MAG: RNA polymerase sigma factor [Blautia sp.]
MQVYSFTMTILKNQSLAEEITQNTFYKAMTTKKQFAGKSSELTWLCGIAKRLAIDECRKHSKFAELDETTIESDTDLTAAVEDRNAALQIHLILHDLQEPYKEVFQLRVFGELSFAQIGLIFKKTENWARVTYHRARLKIQERMENNG